MSNKGYQLADGTWSTEYKVGDTFEVVADDYNCFSVGSIIQMVDDGYSPAPKFKLVEGKCWFKDKLANKNWKNLKAVNPKPKSFTKKDLKDGMWVTYRGDMGLRILIGETLYQFYDGKFHYGEPFNNYCRELKNEFSSSCDIMKVEYMGEVLWEREEQTPLTEEQKRIKELEGIIKKAQEELNKMGVSNG